MPKRLIFKKFARRLKKAYYRILGFLGSVIFALGRILRLIPRIRPYSTDEVRRILIIRMDRIGDVVLSTPTFKAVRQHFREAKIYILVRSYTKDLVIGNPDINKIIIFEDKMPFLKEIINKIREIRKENIDFAIVLHPNFWPNLLAFASGAKYRLGYDAAGSGFFLTKKVKDSRPTNPRHEVEVTLDVVRTLGIDTTDKKLYIPISEEGERFADFFLRDNNCESVDNLIAIHPGGYYHYTHWSVKGFAQVSDYLIEHFAAKVVIVGSPLEQVLANEVVSFMKNSPIIAIGTTLTQLISLLKRCKLFIGNSSGPMHIASASGVPVVAIFGNIHPADHYRHWGTWGEANIVVSKELNCSDCQPADCLRLDCLRLITPQEVIKAAETLLNKIQINKN
ncbi:MAG: glycosyltransferase family 9 protein [Candidatus Omnitrophota bacterium]